MSPAGTPEWVNVLMNMGALGMLMYFAIYGVPALLREYRKDREADRQSREMMLNTFSVELKYERAQCDKHFDDILAAFTKGQDALQAQIRQTRGK